MYFIVFQCISFSINGFCSNLYIQKEVKKKERKKENRSILYQLLYFRYIIFQIDNISFLVVQKIQIYNSFYIFYKKKTIIMCEKYKKKHKIVRKSYTTIREERARMISR